MMSRWLAGIMSKPLTLEDLKDVDEEMATHLEWLLDNDVSDLDFNFSHCLEQNEVLHEVVK